MPHYPVESGVRRDMSARVIALREKLDIRQAELARLLGVSRSYITHMEKGKPCSYPVQKLIEKLEAEAASREQRMKWSNPAAPAATAATEHPDTDRDTHASAIPLLSMHEACALGDAEDAPNLTNEHLTVTVADSHAFAVRVNGDSMQPQHIDGELAIVYPSEAPHTGDRVLARLHDGNGGSVLFRIFNSVDRGQQIVLSSPNPAYPTLQFRLQDFAWIHPVAATLRQFR